MAEEMSIKELTKKRASIKSQLTQFTTFLTTTKTCEQLSEEQLVELEIRVEKMVAVYATYDQFQGQLECLSAKPDEQYAEREQFESSYYRQLASARALLSRHRAQLESKVSPSEQLSVVTRHNSVRLPKIHLPHFSGGYRDWLEFKEIYVSLIHEEPSIDKINKFHYLRSSLNGSAALVIKSLDFRGDNYDNAWQLLCERYDNEQLLVSNHIQALFNVETLHRESSQGLRQVVDETNKNLRSLATLGFAVEHWYPMVIHLMSSKLDPATSRQWEEHRNSLTEFPSLETFTKFISSRCNLLETLEEAKTLKSKPESSQNKPRSLSVSTSKSKFNISCPLCKQNHYLFSCEQFKKLTVTERLLKAKEFKLCLNCLRPGHSETTCPLGHCKYCKSRHNTMLHSHDNDPSTCKEHITLAGTNHEHSSRHVLLSTALVRVTDQSGTPHSARVLLDNGSTANFITKDLCGKLHLPIRSVSSHVAGINSQVSTITQSCSLHLQSCDGTYNIDIDCFVLPNVTTHIPNTYIDLADLQLPAGISLADPSFNVPSSIDILVGADIFWSVIGRNRIQLGRHMPTLFETKLGWLISGAIPQPNLAHSVCMFTHDKHTTHIQEPMDLSRFWELDSISPKYNFTSEERACEHNYNTTTRRNADGRFVVTIPLKESPEALGNSFEMAKRRFLSLERRLDRDPILKHRYVEFLQEYEALGHMSEVTQSSSSYSYYLPHHGVFRESSTTTKLRVVFDASAVTTSGKSFNDIQGIGPRVQDDLISILLRFRQYRYVISSDIEKFFRQIDVDESQRSLQQILWRSDPSLPLKTYTLNTVTYGTASAPFISTRCLSQLAKEATHTRTQQSIRHDFYVDDYLSGSDSIESTIALGKDVINTLKTAQLNLRKWQSNNAQILQAITSTAHSSSTQTTSTKSPTDPPNTVSLNSDEPSKTLGLNWHCHTDSLTFSIHLPAHTSTIITKRLILSTIAQVFDPLGLVSPCIVEAKIILQKLWMDKCPWDDEVNVDIKKLWIKFTQTLPQLNHLSIPRWVVSDSPSTVEVHVFTDSSEKAYGACIYIRSVAGSGTVHTYLLTSKSKVAPIKSTTIPRLELCGALLGTRLCAKVLESLNLKPVNCIFWCDSMIVLGWLSTSPATLKPFVRHRVSEIRDGFGDYTWRYVPSKDNPADLISRGLSADLIGQSSLWWSGPSFLLTDPALWPSMPNTEVNTTLPELLKSHTINNINNHQSLPTTNSSLNTNNNLFQTLINNSSNYLHLQRLLAHVFRFINRCRKLHSHSLALTNSELSYSAEFIIKTVQKEMFPEEYELLSSGKTLPNKNRLKKLSPFIEAGIIRVGGRLDNSCYDYNVRHPIIICSKHNFAKLIFHRYHLRLFHAGPQLLLATIRHEYWPLGGRNLAKSIVHKCVKCQRFNGRTVQPIMGNLPKERIQLEFPFLETGTDYAGPILLADRKGRGCRLIKSYICVFVCLATRAVHLELVSDLTKHAFIAALNRFIARRGKPKTIYSDNGTTFVGTCNEIADILKQDFSSEMANTGINFSFIPAYTPHFGGLWESAVKSIKHHLRRILGFAHLTYEEMSTCLIQVEAILNSRPLTPLSTDPSDLYPLTPAHFLIGRSLTSLPHPQVINQNISSLKRFHRIEHLKQQFWNRFSNEYIFYLQQKTKWTHSDGMLEEGSMVVLKEQHSPPLMWPLGRIVRLIPGRDGISRVADVKTKKGIVRRAYNTICPLPA